MRCHVCGGHMQETRSDMPFKLDRTRIVIIKDLPIQQCDESGEHAFSDAVMQKVEAVLASTDQSAELEIVRIAA